MVQYCMRVGTFMAMVAVAFWALAQDSRMIRIDPAGESTQVFLSYMDATAEDSFARMFEIPKYQDYKPYALLLDERIRAVDCLGYDPMDGNIR